MSSSQALYNRIMLRVEPLVRVTNRKQLRNWVWIIVGILLSESIALSQIATMIPLPVSAEARVTMIRRWLNNRKIDVWAFYEPILAAALQGWRAVNAEVMLDGVSVFGDRMQIFRLSLRHGNRAIPLGWTVIAGKGLTQVEKVEPMLRRVALFLQPRVKRVIFSADRGFRGCEWPQLCLQVGWHYDIRVAHNTYVTFSDGRRCPINQLPVKPGTRRYFQQVQLTQDQQLLTNLSVTWTEGDAKNQPELLAVISDRKACRTRLLEYGERMDIEQSFRDDKSAGFDMAHTRLLHVERLERLLLALAIATLWCHELGEFVLTSPDSVRRAIDPGHTRQLSLFQLGLRWLKRCLFTQLDPVPFFLLLIRPLALAPLSNSS